MSSESRRYQLRARAIRQQETRARIVAATAALHEEVGPARTTVAEIARRAGVERLTVYNHFPQLADLIAACQGHFLASHPPPDLAPRGRGPSLLGRLEEALNDLYSWYRKNQAMESHVHRDRHLVPELDAALGDSVDQSFAALADAYAIALCRTPDRVNMARRLVRLALDFRSWELLAGDGATDAEIAALWTRTIACAVRGTEPGRDRGRSPSPTS